MARGRRSPATRRGGRRLAGGVPCNWRWPPLGLLDAVLQYHTFMFSQGFPPNARGNRGGEPGRLAAVWCPRPAACCQIAMRVAKAHMLILML